MAVLTYSSHGTRTDIKSEYSANNHSHMIDFMFNDLFLTNNSLNAVNLAGSEVVTSN